MGVERRRKGGCVGGSSRVDVGGYVGFGGQEPGRDPHAVRSREGEATMDMVGLRFLVISVFC